MEIEKHLSEVMIMCPATTYDRITVELVSAIQNILPIIRKMERGSPEWNQLIAAIEHMRIAKVMSEEGDGWSDRILEDVEQPEYEIEEERECLEGTCSDEDEEDEE